MSSLRSVADPWADRLPAEWERVQLRRLFRVVNGSTPSSDEPSYWGGRVPWVTPADLGDQGARDIDGGERSLTKAGYESCGATLVPAGSLVLSTRAPIGYVAIARRDLCTNQGCRSLVATRSIEPRYFYYALIAARPLLQVLGQGATFAELTTRDLAELVVPCPSFPQQRAIASLLDGKLRHLDKALAALDRQLVRLGEYRTGRITTALTGGIGVGEFREHAQAPLPDQWSVVRLRYLLTKPLSYGVLKPVRSHAEDAVPLVRTCDITEHGSVLRDQLIAISPEQAREYRRTRLEEGDVVVSVVGTIGRSFVVGDDLEGANLSRALARISTSGRVLADWVDAYIRSDLFKARAGLIAAGTAQKVLNMGDLSDFPLPVPPLSEQRRILGQLKVAMATLGGVETDLREERARLVELRQAMISDGVCGRLKTRSRVST